LSYCQRPWFSHATMSEQELWDQLPMAQYESGAASWEELLNDWEPTSDPFMGFEVG